MCDASDDIYSAVRTPGLVAHRVSIFSLLNLPKMKLKLNEIYTMHVYYILNHFSSFDLQNNIFARLYDKWTLYIVF